tara:strand:- start:6960 stop:7931 length:972 start_codon:yes stop_codon:yes gene_type:complete
MKYSHKTLHFFLILLSVYLNYSCQSKHDSTPELINQESLTQDDSTDDSNQELPYSLPSDCYVNPFLNCQGASLGNYLNAYYLVGDFDTFYAFISNSSKTQFGRDKIYLWFTTMNFGFSIHAVNMMKTSDYTGTLVYNTTINNTRGRMTLPYIIENDTAKLAITSLKVDIDKQYSHSLLSDLSAINNRISKLDISNVIIKSRSANDLTLILDGSILFDSGKYNLNPLGLESTGKLIEYLQGIKSNELKITCTGYTDSDKYKTQVGDIRNNRDLSVMRASTISDVLIKSGIVKESNCITQGFGDQQNSQKSDKKYSRRVEINVKY